MRADFTLVFEALMNIPTSGVAINKFKQALHLAVAAAEFHDFVSIGEVGHTDVGSNVNPWVMLQSLAKNPVGRVESRSQMALSHSHLP